MHGSPKLRVPVSIRPVWRRETLGPSAMRAKRQKVDLDSADTREFLD